jgi:hypothetical protein
VSIRASPQRREKLARQCTFFGQKNLELIADVKTRWNSTNDMIERALTLREVRDTFLILIFMIRGKKVDDERGIRNKKSSN